MFQEEFQRLQERGKELLALGFERQVESVSAVTYRCGDNKTRFVLQHAGHVLEYDQTPEEFMPVNGFIVASYRGGYVKFTKRDFLNALMGKESDMEEKRMTKLETQGRTIQALGLETSAKWGVVCDHAHLIGNDGECYNHFDFRIGMFDDPNRDELCDYDFETLVLHSEHED